MMPQIKTELVRGILIGLISFGMATSFVLSASAQEVDHDADVALIEAVKDEAIAAYVARDWDRFSDVFAEDAIWMPRNRPPLVGEEAWWSFIEGSWNSTRIVEMDVVTEEIIVFGDWAYERHSETITTAPTDGSGEPQTVRFKGVWLLHRENDGSWKIARYIWNRNPDSN